MRLIYAIKFMRTIFFPWSQGSRNSALTCYFLNRLFSSQAFDEPQCGLLLTYFCPNSTAFPNSTFWPMASIYLLSWISTELLYHEKQKNKSLFEKSIQHTPAWGNQGNSVNRDYNYYTLWKTGVKVVCYQASFPPWAQDSSKHTATAETDMSFLSPVCSFFGRYFNNFKCALNDPARPSCADSMTPIAYAGSKDARPARIVLEAWARWWDLWADRLLTCPQVLPAVLGTGTASCSTPEGILVLRQHVGPRLG